MTRLVTAFLFAVTAATPYSVLTHEAIVDSAWDISIKPLLLSRYPGATADQLVKAHAYAYGGAIVQDFGYYPLGSRFFSDLTHYVRSGDFIRYLVAEASTLEEFAFALGAVAHYSADNIGHVIAVNRSVALLYPKLNHRYGDAVTFEQDPGAHLKVEFGFDVAQVAKQHYAPQSYHDFIGFEVAKELLERAFARTYGLQLKDIFNSLDLAIGTFRFSVSQVIPQMTRVAWAAREREITAAVPGITREKFIYNLSRASFEKEWGREYERPGWFARFLGFLFRILPKIGPLRAFAFRAPTPETEKLFMESFNQTLDRYKSTLTGVRGSSIPEIRNDNFDTGRPSKWGDYKLADKAFERLLRELARKQFAGVTPEMRAALIAHAAGVRTGRDELRRNLRRLQEITPP